LALAGPLARASPCCFWIQRFPHTFSTPPPASRLHFGCDMATMLEKGAAAIKRRVTRNKA
jgi:hypothetical protein